MPQFDHSQILPVLAAAGLLLAAWSALAGVRALRRVRPVRAGLSALAFCAFTAGGLLFGALAWNLHTFQRFTSEQSVLELTFEQQSSQRYLARLQTPDGTHQTVILNGDEWQLDVRMLKWSGLATVLGFRPVYRLERLSGRYHDTAQELNAERTVHAFAAEEPFDLWSSARVAGWLPWVDARYGSAAYLPMRDGAAYLVTIGNNGLIARPVNDIAVRAVAKWD